MPKLINITSLLVTMGLLFGCSSTQDNSRWMSQNKSALGNKTLGQITIPGSHFANAYELNSSLPICKGETLASSQTTNAKIIMLNGHVVESSADEFVTYLNTQDENIYQQLNSGIRYLEIQVCLQDNIFYTSNYFIGDNLNNIITQINHFLNENPDEIILLDLDNNVRDETGFLGNHGAKQLNALFTQSFKDRLITKTEINDIHKQQLKQIWQTKGRVLIISSNPTLISDNIWDKNSLVGLDATPRWTTIKKLTNIQIAVDELQESNIAYMSIIPIYSRFDPERNTPQEIGNNFNNHLIVDYLYTFPESTPLNILVSEGQFNYDIVKFSLRGFNN